MPGESHGQGSLVGCSPWGLKELDTTEQIALHRFGIRCETRNAVGAMLNTGIYKMSHWKERAPRIQKCIRKKSRSQATPNELGDPGGSPEPLNPDSGQVKRSLLGGSRGVEESRLSSLPARTGGCCVLHFTDVQFGSRVRGGEAYHRSLMYLPVQPDVSLAGQTTIANCPEKCSTEFGANCDYSGIPGNCKY